MRGRTEGPRWLAILTSRPNSPAEGDDDLAARDRCFAATLSHLRIPAFTVTVSPEAEAELPEALAPGTPSSATLGPPTTGSVPAILGPPAPGSEPATLGPPTSRAGARPDFGWLASLAKFSANCSRMVCTSSALAPEGGGLALLRVAGASSSTGGGRPGMGGGLALPCLGFCSTPIPEEAALGRAGLAGTGGGRSNPCPFGGEGTAVPILLGAFGNSLNSGADAAELRIISEYVLGGVVGAGTGSTSTGSLPI